MADGGDIRVSGGAGGVTASYDDMLSYAGVLDAAGDGLRDTSGRLGGLVVSGDLAQAVVLCPVEVAEAEGAIVAAATGPSGALWASGELEVSARFIRTSVATYTLIDEQLANLEDLAYDAGGFLLGASLPALALLGALGYAGLQGNPQLKALLDKLGVEAPTLEDLQETIYDNPWLAEALTRMAPGLVQGTTFTLASLLGPQGIAALIAASGGNWPTTDYPSAISGLLALAGLAGQLQDTGNFGVDRVPGDPKPLTITEENALATIFDQQRQLGADDGQVQIIEVAHPPHGEPTYIVQIPGTQDWSPSRGDNPVDLTTNVNLMAMGGSTVMEQQVADAMTKAGIDPGDPVMLTGHSQGGITAAAMASDPAMQERYNITSVVTGGSPIGQFDIPEDVSVMSLEHDQDVVPMLDGADNPDEPNWVTVQRELSDAEGTKDGQRGPGAAHGLENYRTTGADADASDDESIEAWRQRNEQFFDGDSSASRYQISREDD